MIHSNHAKILTVLASLVAALYLGQLQYEDSQPLDEATAILNFMIRSVVLVESVLAKDKKQNDKTTN
mgnify:CR=1 FL=1